MKALILVNAAALAVKSVTRNHPMSTNPTIPTEELVAIAKLFHEAMVHAATEFKGKPEPWQNGNSTAESYARQMARAAIEASGIEALKAALDSALDFVVDVMNEATPGSIYHTNAVECHRVGSQALTTRKV